MFSKIFPNIFEVFSEFAFIPVILDFWGFFILKWLICQPVTVHWAAPCGPAICSVQQSEIEVQYRDQIEFRNVTLNNLDGSGMLRHFFIRSSRIRALCPKAPTPICFRGVGTLVDFIQLYHSAASNIAEFPKYFTFRSAHQEFWISFSETELNGKTFSQQKRNNEANCNL